MDELQKKVPVLAEYLMIHKILLDTILKASKLKAVILTL